MITDKNVQYALYLIGLFVVFRIAVNTIKLNSLQEGLESVTN